MKASFQPPGKCILSRPPWFSWWFFGEQVCYCFKLFVWAGIDRDSALCRRMSSPRLENQNGGDGVEEHCWSPITRATTGYLSLAALCSCLRLFWNPENKSLPFLVFSSAGTRWSCILHTVDQLMVKEVCSSNNNFVSPALTFYAMHAHNKYGSSLNWQS